MGPLWKVLPDGWQAGQVKNAATVTLGKMLQSKDSGSDVRAPYMRAANVQPNGVLALDDVNEMWFGKSELEQLSIRAGDVVVVEGGQGGFGRAAYVDQDLPDWGFQNSINRLRPIGDFDGRFIAFYLIALRASGFIRAYSNVVSMPHLTAEKLARIPIPLPPVEVQRAIADYLDPETARIDTLIEEQQRLIETLRERRRAVVDGAVRRGVRNVRLRDSGDPLVGDVPEDWLVIPVRRVATLLDSKRIPLSAEARAERPGRYPYYGATSVIDYVDDYLFDEQLVLVAEDGFGLLYRSKPIALHVTGRIWVNNHAHVLRPLGVPAKLLAARIEAESLVPYVSGSRQPKLTADTLMAMRISFPPEDQWGEVLAVLDEETASIDTLIAETERFIELARERRTALVTAAVTGQIDVREAV
ncbi:restriction endonuclease subunit S [Streptomyces sp. NRRL B-1677]|uniref:restriction endonuclease subunit S n=1 Tax=Streptomyces sp. NRRL B-1677 TaxID=2682966 RepID=UPI001892CFF4|nr:restriction endonuclease subunit S [Streptomyces sp. NRRL B-1677]MBF6045475.1 restriction endonuclease subunit S [Streptomyces sp. NRRL B-1677]